MTRPGSYTLCAAPATYSSDAHPGPPLSLRCRPTDRLGGRFGQRRGVFIAPALRTARPDIGPISAYQHLLAARGTAQGRDVAAYVDTGSRFHRPVLGGVLDRFYFGIPGDIPLMGDWDCDGVRTPALYRASNGYVYLTNANQQGVAESQFFYGIAGDIPLAGDWNGDGCEYTFGVPGDQPFAGDFDGDGTDTIGMYRLRNALVYYRNSHTSGLEDRQFFFGLPGDRLVAGDWDGDGDDTVAVYRRSSRYLIVNMENNSGPSEYSLWVGDFETVVVSTGS